MKPKIKLSKKKSFHNPLETSAPPLEILQINSVRTRKKSFASLANTVLALNMIFLLKSVVFICLYLRDVSLFLISCQSHCVIKGLDLLSCLEYIAGSSFLIIAIKKARVDYFNKFQMMITCIIFQQILKGFLYFIFHEMNNIDCIFDYVDYDTTIIISGIIVGMALMYGYFIRKLKLTTEGTVYMNIII